MQHAWKHVERPSGSHTALDGKKPVLGSRFGPKSGVSHQRILLLPAEVLQADLRRTSMNACFFSPCVPLCFLYSRGPFLAAMFLLVFWILFWEP